MMKLLVILFNDIFDIDLILIMISCYDYYDLNIISNYYLFCNILKSYI